MPRSPPRTRPERSFSATSGGSTRRVSRRRRRTTSSRSRTARARPSSGVFSSAPFLPTAFSAKKPGSRAWTKRPPRGSSTRSTARRISCAASRTGPSRSLALGAASSALSRPASCGIPSRRTSSPPRPARERSATGRGSTCHRAGTCEGAALATGFPFRQQHQIDRYLSIFRALFMKSRSIRRAGSAALDLAYVACGIFDGFFEFGLSPWDTAAGALLVTEAGGVVTDFDGGASWRTRGNVLAATPGLHSALLDGHAGDRSRREGPMKARGILLALCAASAVMRADGSPDWFDAFRGGPSCRATRASSRARSRRRPTSPPLFRARWVVLRYAGSARASGVGGRTGTSFSSRCPPERDTSSSRRWVSWTKTTSTRTAHRGVSPRRRSPSRSGWRARWKRTPRTSRPATGCASASGRQAGRLDFFIEDLGSRTVRVSLAEIAAGTFDEDERRDLAALLKVSVESNPSLGTSFRGTSLSIYHLRDPLFAVNVALRDQLPPPDKRTIVFVPDSSAPADLSSWRALAHLPLGSPALPAAAAGGPRAMREEVGRRGDFLEGEEASRLGRGAPRARTALSPSKKSSSSSSLFLSISARARTREEPPKITLERIVDGRGNRVCDIAKASVKSDNERRSAWIVRGLLRSDLVLAPEFGRTRTRESRRSTRSGSGTGRRCASKAAPRAAVSRRRRRPRRFVTSTSTSRGRPCAAISRVSSTRPTTSSWAPPRSTGP